MARGCPPESEIYYQRQRSGPFAFARANYPTYTIQQRSSILSQMEAEGGKGLPRKRIAVACSRCRKRKIKCSGDKGDGQGCTNCRNSANGGPGGCQFLRVSSQDIGSLYPESHSVHGSPSNLSQNGEMAYYNQGYYNLQHSMAGPANSRPPRHYASNVFYNGVTMMPETQGRNTEAIMDSFPYPGAGPTSYNSCYQAGMYGQPDGGQYYGANSSFQRHQMENDSFRYPQTQVSHLNGQPVGDGHSSFSSMDQLAHSLPSSATAQRTLPTPRNSSGALTDSPNQLSQLQSHPQNQQQQQQQQQPVLKSQGVGSLGSYSGTALLAPSNAEMPSPDLVSSLSYPYPHPQQPQQRTSLKSIASNSFSELFGSSSRPSLQEQKIAPAGGVTGQQQQVPSHIDKTDMAHHDNSSVPGPENYGSQTNRTSCAVDSHTGGSKSGSSSNTSSAQYALSSTSSSKRGSQTSSFAAFDDAGVDGKRNSAASGGSAR